MTTYKDEGCDRYEITTCDITVNQSNNYSKINMENFNFNMKCQKKRSDRPISQIQVHVQI